MDGNCSKYIIFTIDFVTLLNSSKWLLFEEENPYDAAYLGFLESMWKDCGYSFDLEEEIMSPKSLKFLKVLKTSWLW